MCEFECVLFIWICSTAFSRATSRHGGGRNRFLSAARVSCDHILRSTSTADRDAALSLLQHTQSAFLTKMVRNLNTIYNILHRLNNLCCIALNAFSVCNVFSSLLFLLSARYARYRCFDVYPCFSSWL